MKKIALILNNPNSVSEVFIHELFRSLSKNYEISIYYFENVKVNNPLLSQLKTKKIHSYKSLKFLIFFIRKIILLLTTDLKIKDIYFLFILSQIKSTKIYIPFISMLRDFKNVLAYTKSEIYTSIRGTDITITPIINSSVIEDYKLIYKHLKGIHYLSEELKEMAHNYDLFHSNEHVIYQSIDYNIINFKNKLPTDKLRMISVGRLHYVKGFEFLLKIANKLNEEHVDFELNIVGSGNEYEYLVFLRDLYELNDRVNFLGQQNKIMIKEILSNHNIYLHTHKVNGLSNTMLEALFSGLSLVVFDSNLDSYNIPDFQNKFIEVPKFDIDKTVKVLKRLYLEKSYGNKEDDLIGLKKYFDLSENIKKYNIYFES